jgi:branched-chain amino acid transport system permease protein
VYLGQEEALPEIIIGDTMKFIRLEKSNTIATWAPYLIAVIIFIIVPFAFPTFFQSIFTKGLIFAIFAMSLDIIYGYSALFSLGHAAFFGAGAYAVGMLALRAGISSFWIVLPTSLIIPALLAALFGLVAIRFKDIYFLLVTFALGQVMFVVAYMNDWLKSSGLEGIANIRRPNFGIGAGFRWDTVSLYIFVLIVFIICFFLMRRIVNSPFGKSLVGIRESEPRMRTLGYNTWLYKYLAFIIAGFFAGIAGMLYAWDRGFAGAEVFGADYSFLIMVMVIIGGTGTLWGPIIGAFLLVFVEQFTSLYFPERWPLVLGVIILLTSLFFRGGIAPHLVNLTKRMRKTGNLKSRETV